MLSDSIIDLEQRGKNNKKNIAKKTVLADLAAHRQILFFNCQFGKADG